MPSVSHALWEMKTDNLDEEARVHFIGQDIVLDESASETLHSRLFQVVEDSGRNRIFVDMKNIAFLTSSVLGVFLQLDKMLHASGGRLSLGYLQPQIFEIFTVTNLNRILDVHPA